MTKSISKQDLKKADQFTQTGRSLLEHIVKNQKIVLTVLILFVLGGVGFIVWDKTRYNKETIAEILNPFKSIQNSNQFASRTAFL